MNYSEKIYYDSILANKLLPITVATPRAWMNERIRRAGDGLASIVILLFFRADCESSFSFPFGPFVGPSTQQTMYTRITEKNAKMLGERCRRKIIFTSINYSISGSFRFNWKRKKKKNQIDSEHFERLHNIFEFMPSMENDFNRIIVVLRRIKWQI